MAKEEVVVVVVVFGVDWTGVFLLVVEASPTPPPPSQAGAATPASLVALQLKMMHTNFSIWGGLD